MTALEDVRRQRRTLLNEATTRLSLAVGSLAPLQRQALIGVMRAQLLADQTTPTAPDPGAVAVAAAFVGYVEAIDVFIATHPSIPDPEPQP